MKKNMKGILFFALIGIVSIGCEKEEIEKSAQGDKKPATIKYELNNIPLDKEARASMVNEKARSGYVYDYHKLAQNPGDADDEKINKLLFKLTEATAELIKDPNFNQLIISMASNTKNSAANLLDLKTAAPQYYTKINQNLSSYGLSLQLIADSLTHNPIAPNSNYPETEEIEQYVPAIFIPNKDILDPTLQPLISPNLEVDARNDDALEDNIVGWYYKDPNDVAVQETILDEESSLRTTNPLFFIDNAVETLEGDINPGATAFYGIDSCIYTDTSSGLNSKNKQPTNQLSSTRSFSSREHRIKGSSYRYESWFSGKSEFAIIAYRIDPSGTPHWIYSTGASNHKVISKIKRSDVSNWSWQWNWSHHASDWQPWYNSWNFPANQNGVNYVFWNTFERDWNRSKKWLGTANRNGTTIYLSGRCKYSSEWYAWIPSTVWVHNTQFVWIDYYWAHWNNSWKADFRLWKVYI